MANNAHLHSPLAPKHRAWLDIMDVPSLAEEGWQFYRRRGTFDDFRS